MRYFPFVAVAVLAVAGCARKPLATADINVAESAEKLVELRASAGDSSATGGGASGRAEAGRTAVNMPIEITAAGGAGVLVILLLAGGSVALAVFWRRDRRTLYAVIRGVEAAGSARGDTAKTAIKTTATLMGVEPRLQRIVHRLSPDAK